MLVKEGPRQEAGAILLDVLSACMAIGDLAYGGRGYLPLTFIEEVSKLLTINNYSFDTKHPVTGLSKTKYQVDFQVITHHRVSLIHTLAARTNTGVRTWVNAAYRMWADIRTNNEVVRRVSLLNDEGGRIRGEDIRLLATVSDVYRWSQRQQFIASLEGGQPASIA